MANVVVCGVCIPIMYIDNIFFFMKKKYFRFYLIIWILSHFSVQLLVAEQLFTGTI